MLINFLLLTQITFFWMQLAQTCTDYHKHLHTETCSEILLTRVMVIYYTHTSYTIGAYIGYSDTNQTFWSYSVDTIKRKSFTPETYKMLLKRE